MRKLILIFMPLALVMGQTKKKMAASKPAVATQAAAPAEAPKIPDGAKQVEPYLYSYTDKSGKKWLYRQTPFGVVKWEDKPAVAAPVADASEPVVTADLGDSIRFTRSTPFGAQTWIRKKSELTDEDKAMMKAAQDKQSAADPNAAVKPRDTTKKIPEKQ